MKFADEKTRRNRNINNTNEALAQQIREKELKKLNEWREELSIAEYYKSQQQIYQQEESNRIEQEKQRKNKYLGDLNKQKIEAKKKRQFGVLMSEHERNVHDTDITAYQHMDYANGKLSGDPV